MSRLRRRDLIPEDTPITGTFKEPKIVHGKFGRQVEAKVLTTKGEYKGTEFKDWFSFGKDDTDGEEFIPYGGILYDVLAMVEPNIEEVLDDDNLSEKKYQQFVKNAVKKLDGFEFIARVGIKAPKNNPEKKRNFLQPGSIGPAVDEDDDFNDIDMEKESA